MVAKSRAKLLAAGAEEFARHGLRGTRVRDVVDRAGVNERMLYEHFGSKEGLYRAVLDEASTDVGDAWRPVLEQAATLEPRAGMRVALRAFFDLVADRPSLVPLMLHEGLGEATVRMPIDVDQLPDPLTALYERGRVQGVFRADCDFTVLYAAAMALLTMLSGLPNRFTGLVGEDTGAPARERLRDQLVDLLLDGMTGPGDREDSE